MASRRSARRRRITAAIDPNLLNGWGIRPNDWQIGASIQQQLMPRVSVEFGYFRRWLNNFTATDNTLVAAADFTPFALNAPSIRGCRAAAATRSAVSTTSPRRRFESRGGEQHHRRRGQQRRNGVLALQRHPGQRERPRRATA